MHVLSISGTYRKGKTIDSLLDKAIEGVKTVQPDAAIEKISLIKSFCQTCLDAKVVGSLYAGAVERRGVERYFEKSYRLGKKLATD